jgi:hypothetical protein
MPQSVVNMEDINNIKLSRNLNNNRFKMRYAPYSNRCSKLKQII